MSVVLVAYLIILSRKTEIKFTIRTFKSGDSYRNNPKGNQCLTFLQSSLGRTRNSLVHAKKKCECCRGLDKPKDTFKFRELGFDGFRVDPNEFTLKFNDVKGEFIDDS